MRQRVRVCSSRSSPPSGPAPARGSACRWSMASSASPMVRSTSPACPACTLSPTACRCSKSLSRSASWRTSCNGTPVAEAPSALIYVVEDDAEVSRLVLMALHEFGFVTQAFRDGATVLRRLQSERPDLCVIDLGLPDMDGMELVHEITRRRGCGVLILTGRGHTVHRVMSLESG